MSTRVPERATVQTGHEETGYPRVVQHLHHERRDDLKTQKTTKPLLTSTSDFGDLNAARIKEKLYMYVLYRHLLSNEYKIGKLVNSRYYI